MQLAEGLVPFIDFTGPAPFGQRLCNNAEVSNGPQEFGHRESALVQSIGDIQPELVLSFRKSGPDLGRMPQAGAPNGHAQLLEVPEV